MTAHATEEQLNAARAALRDLVRDEANKRGARGAQKRAAKRAGLSEANASRFLHGGTISSAAAQLAIDRARGAAAAPQEATLGDAEISAMRALAALDDAACARVIAWAKARWE